MHIAMTIISSKEFAANQQQYFDLAVTEQVYIQNGKNTFTVSVANEKRKKHKHPDADFYRAITMEEFRKRVHEDIDVIFESK